jgi:hypothetical protein
VPARLPHGLALPVLLPVADVADGDRLGEEDDAVHQARPGHVDVPPVADHDLLVALRAAEVPHHLRRVEPAQQVEIPVLPRLDLHLGHPARVTRGQGLTGGSRIDVCT